jgi:hypothetical protein
MRITFDFRMQDKKCILNTNIPCIVALSIGDVISDIMFHYLFRTNENIAVMAFRAECGVKALR